jgi:hypothetical protein
VQWADVFKIAIGAVLAVGSGFLTQVYFARQGELTQRVDELIKLVWDYADLSSNYWLSERVDEKIVQQEAKIVAIDHYIGSVIANLAQDGARFKQQREIDRLLTHLSETATGGNFQVAGRKVNDVRSQQVYSNAGELCVALRSERRKLLKWNPFW